MCYILNEDDQLIKLNDGHPISVKKAPIWPLWGFLETADMIQLLATRGMESLEVFDYIWNTLFHQLTSYSYNSSYTQLFHTISVAT